MAASTPSKISKALSKVVSPTVGSPKKSLHPSSLLRAQETSGTVFKKPTEDPKRLVSKTVKKTLAVPTPTRRPPSIPLSTWNADHAEVIKSTQKTGTTVGGAKKKVGLPVPTLTQDQTPNSKVNKSTDSKKTIPSSSTRKLPSLNSHTISCNNEQKNSTPRIVPAAVLKKATSSSNTRGQMKTSTSTKSFKPTSVVKPISSPPLEYTEALSLMNDTASSMSTALADLQDKVDGLTKKINSIYHLTPPINPPTEEIYVQIDKNVPSDETQFISENKDKENNSGCKSLKDSKNNTAVYMNDSSLSNFVKIETPNNSETTCDPNDLGVGPGTQNNLSPFKSPSVDQLNNMFGPKTYESPMVRSRRFPDSISSPRSVSGDRPCSPFGQPRLQSRVLHNDQQNVNFIDAIFAPYLTDDENATVMRSPRYSF